MPNTHMRLPNSLQKRPQSFLAAFLGILVLLAGCEYPAPSATPTMPAPAVTETVTPAPYPNPMTAPFTAPVNPYPGPDSSDTFPPGSIFLFPVYNSRPELGSQVWAYSASTTKTKPFIEGLKPGFVAMPVYWKDIEPYNDIWLWPSRLDLDVKYLLGQNIRPLLVLKIAPAWARSPGSLECSRPTDPAEFAEFAGQVAARYQDKIILEIWNEPDTDLDGGVYYGCWGDPAEPYYGGEFYGKILDLAYPAIKKNNPEATVLAGALTAPCPGNCPMGTYAEAWAGSDNYDALSFHFYAWYPDTHLHDDIIDYLSSLTDRPLWMTETNLLSYMCDAKQEANAVSWASRIKHDWRLAAVSWFYLQPAGDAPKPWDCTGMLYDDWSTKPVYEEWKP